MQHEDQGHMNKKSSSVSSRDDPKEVDVRSQTWDKELIKMHI